MKEKTRKELEQLKNVFTPKQLEFVELYVNGYTPKEAYMKSGLGDNGRDAANLLRKPIFARYIDLLNRVVCERSILSLEAIDQKLTDIAMTDITDIAHQGHKYIDDNGNEIIPVLIRDENDLTMSQKSAIKSIKSNKGGGLEIEMHDKLKAIDMLIKRRAGYTEKQELNVTSPVQVIACVGDNGRFNKED